jgi:microcystin-dependent protein
MSEPFIGQIILFAGNFPPKGYATCDGQLLSIAQNTALFSILGTTYGGNGISNFALPDLRGRAPIHMGQSPGFSSYVLGQTGGEENHTLIAQEMPQHNHTVSVGVSSEPAGQTNPNAQVPGGGQFYAPPSEVNGALGGVACSQTGGGLPHNNMQPYLVVNYCIALQGVFPSRN